MSGASDPIERRRAPSEDPISRALRTGLAVADTDFDRLFPRSHRRRSTVHWTPMEVALRASTMLAECPGGRILDVGSGAGKMCIVGALTSTAHWTGVEQDGAMVRVATRVAKRLDVDAQTTFIHADGLTLDWRPFGGIYLFNPFSEEVFRTSPEDPLLSHTAFIQSVLEVEARLDTLRLGARVVTLHGFGGELPPAFEEMESVPMHGDLLCLWVRTR